MHGSVCAENVMTESDPAQTDFQLGGLEWSLDLINEGPGGAHADVSERAAVLRPPTYSFAEDWRCLELMILELLGLTVRNGDGFVSEEGRPAIDASLSAAERQLLRRLVTPARFDQLDARSIGEAIEDLLLTLTRASVTRGREPGPGLRRKSRARPSGFRRHGRRHRCGRDPYALQPSIPHLTRSALHRCLQRHGISRLPDIEGDKPKRQRFKRYPIGFFHIDIAEVRTVEGKLYLFVGIDRTSKFAVTQLVEKADRRTAWEFLEHLLEVVPYRIHTILTDNGIQFAEQPRNRNTAWSRQMRFDMVCEANDIEHRLTKPNHPWTNGQVERMNRTIKEASVKRFHYDSHDQLRTHLADFMAAYNFARRLKTLSGLTPTNTSPKSGLQSQSDSRSIRSTRCRD